MKRKQVTLLIPCLNENITIRKAILDAKKQGDRFFKKDYDIVVADNGSTDGTLSTVRKIKGVNLIKVPVKGYGAALHWGILKSKSRYIVFADADLSYPFSNLKRFAKVIANDSDLVIGSRFLGRIEKGAMPLLHRFLGTPVLTFLINVIYRMHVTDCNSGMRMVKKSFYRKLNMRNSGMEWASEILCKTALKSGKYSEVPILFKKDKRGRKPHLSSWADGWRHLKAIFLIKPNTLIIPLSAFLAGAVFFYKKNFALSFLFSDLFVVLGLSLATLHLLESLIEKKISKLSEYLLRFTLVPVTIAISLMVGVGILILPDDRLGTKLFLVSMIGTIFMWIFLVETIKTHLANRLPDVK